MSANSLAEALHANARAFTILGMARSRAIVLGAAASLAVLAAVVGQTDRCWRSHSAAVACCCNRKPCRRAIDSIRPAQRMHAQAAVLRGGGGIPLAHWQAVPGEDERSGWNDA